MPLNTSTLRPLHIAAMPPTSPATIFCLRCLGHGEVDGRRGLDAELGGVGDVAVDRRRLEERLGRDAPRLRHVPPRASFSTIATFTPAEAAYSAAA